MKILPIFIALDVETKEQAIHLVKETKGLVFGYKLGPRLFLSYGMELIKEIRKQTSAKIFLDFKFYDIPSSTLQAVQTAFHLGIDFVTVHALVGQKTLRLLSHLEKKIKQERFFQILFVTLLSSVEDSKENQKKVFDLAHQVYEAGLRGLVCSPWEARVLKQKYQGIFLVTPGIRLEGESREDQQRVMTPKQALSEGSSALVMGRSLIKNPIKVLEMISNSLKRA